MAFDAELVSNRICDLAHHYIAKYLPPPVWFIAGDDTSSAENSSSLDYAVKVTHNGLKLTSTLFKYVYSQAKVHFYQKEIHKIDDILSSLSDLKNPDSCEDWIACIIQMGEEAHMPEQRTYFSELLHAIRHIILENIQADEKGAERLKAKSDFLKAHLQKIRQTIDEHYDAGHFSPDLIEPLEKETHVYLRKLAWIGEHASIRGTHQIRQVFPDTLYRYFDGHNAKKRQLPHAIYPIVLATGEKSFYCYFAKKLDILPNHNHKMAYHAVQEEGEYLFVSEINDPPIYRDKIPKESRLKFFQPGEKGELDIANDPDDEVCELKKSV